MDDSERSIVGWLQCIPANKYMSARGKSGREICGSMGHVAYAKVESGVGIIVDFFYLLAAEACPGPLANVTVDVGPYESGSDEIWWL